MMHRGTITPEGNLDSLTDTLTNTMGLILLLVIGTVLVSGGMKLVLLGQMEDPGDRTPVYVTCRDGRVHYLHRGDEWKRRIAEVCRDLEGRIDRPPGTSEALRELNRLRPCDTPDYRAVFVREQLHEGGQDVYVIGIRFLPHQRRDTSEPGAFSPATAEAFSRLNPAEDYVYALVYETGADVLAQIEEYARERGIRLGWRPIEEGQNPGLSDTGLPGWIQSGGAP